MSTIVQAVVLGILVVIAGTIPRNLIFAANLRYYASLPWAVPLTAVYLWFFWRYLKGSGPPQSTAHQRRTALRANRVSGYVWGWALVAGSLGIIALVLALRVANRLVILPPQQLPGLAYVPKVTVFSLLITAAPVAGIVEESAFRGYMQGTIERRYGLAVAILVTGTMFAIVHLDFAPVLWPYYVAVAAIYGTVTHLTDSILPAIVLHTGGNIYSNMDLWLHGQAEWQASPSPAMLIWTTGTDASFWIAIIALSFVATAMGGAYFQLARVARRKSASPIPG